VKTGHLYVALAGLVVRLLVVWLLAPCIASAQAPKKPPTVINPPPTAQDWADLAKLPDWTGVWNPKITDQDAQVRTNPPPWNEAAAKKIQQMFADEKSGRPFLVFSHCLPEAHPSWMLVTHNAMEILFSPGRVTMLGESDGNRIRRIYTDGREHPQHSDPTFHGHSIGHWEGDTLVVDTVDILPQAPLAISEAAGLPNNGDMHVIERIHLADKDILHDDLEIIAPKILTKPWKTTRIFFRQRAQVRHRGRRLRHRRSGRAGQCRRRSHFRTGRKIRMGPHHSRSGEIAGNTNRSFLCDNS
jgi:hypothetical protein